MSNKLLFLLVTALLLGCSTDTSAPEPPQQSPSAVSEERQTPTQSEGDSKFTHVITTDTEYYTIGLQQAQPPDGTLKAGTKVNVVEDAGSYCRVENEDGVVGFVAVDAVKEAQKKKD